MATPSEKRGGSGPAYTRLFELGRGGMARVHLAESHVSGLRKLVVLKELNPEFIANPEVRAAFRREAELSAQMNHPNVVQVIAVNEHMGVPAIVMEYLDGIPLSTLLHEAARFFPLRLRLFVLTQVLAGLHHFHELKDFDGAPLHAVHRDVSPQNVMVLYDGPVKVLDFGIAKVGATGEHATHAGTVKGKIHYMPPEQLLDGCNVDRRADVFAVGVMLWEAVADRRMWQGKTESELLRSLASGSLPDLGCTDPDVPGPVLDIVARATNIDRDKRFETALQMQRAIEQVLAERGWIVQQRDLAEFMVEHFGERRHQRELKIMTARSALRDPGARENLTLRTRVLPISEPPRESVKPTARISDLAVSHTLWKHRRSWGWVLGAAACVVFAGTWTLRREPLRPKSVANRPAASTVTLEVEAHPAGAEIHLNGKVLARDRFVGDLPRDDARVLLEVMAPGYASKRREISLRKDLSLQIVLEQEPSAEAPPPPVSNASPSPPTTGATLPRRPLDPASQATSTRKVTHKGVGTNAQRSRQCNPPYTLGLDGVKTYKPECF